MKLTEILKEVTSPINFKVILNREEKSAEAYITREELINYFRPNAELKGIKKLINSIGLDYSTLFKDVKTFKIETDKDDTFEIRRKELLPPEGVAKPVEINMEVAYKKAGGQINIINITDLESVADKTPNNINDSRLINAIKDFLKIM